MALIQLLYVSSATEPLDAAGLARILESAVRLNNANQITGMLLYAGGNFMQVLEGEEAKVIATFERIAQDARHHNLIELMREPAAARDFSRWFMGFRQLGIEDARHYPAFAPFFKAGFDPASIGARPGLALDMLKCFSETVR